MKKLLIGLMLFSCMLVLGGCTSAETVGEHSRRMLLTADLQARTMVEDWDFFWLSERNCRLTYRNTRVGY